MKKYKYSFAPDANAKGGVEATIAAAVSLGFWWSHPLFPLYLKDGAVIIWGRWGCFLFLLSAYGFYLGN